MERYGGGARDLLYVKVERSLEDLLVRGRYKVGDRLPPEMRLVEELEVSRATVRAGLARLEGRGLVERRQGSGTFLARVPEGVRLTNGLERLETYSVQARRLGLALGSRDVMVEAGEMTAKEARTLEAVGGRVVRVSRVLLVDGEAAAWMYDLVPEAVIPAGEIERRFRADEMVLDLLIRSGVGVEYSELHIDTEMLEPDVEIGAALEVGSPVAALSLTETMYLGGGRPVQHSRNIFLPGSLDLRVVREILD
ncbi:GntR family transcriptional regulator [Rubrobacter indicoceani]|uniref:GntR family transcriptional regulator n=1 Tax=Rubrobacter indicoceani TaxID=2051957 RepID=UPI000E5AD2D0|nr:GntR family transcriptional regulator [Rubrobacter indicoceani]